MSQISSLSRNGAGTNEGYRIRTYVSTRHWILTPARLATPTTPQCSHRDLNPSHWIENPVCLAGLHYRSLCSYWDSNPGYCLEKAVSLYPRLYELNTMRVSGFEPERNDWKSSMLPLTLHSQRQRLELHQRILRSLSLASWHITTLSHWLTPPPGVEPRCHYDAGFKPAGLPLPNRGINIFTNEW